MSLSVITELVFNWILIIFICLFQVPIVIPFIVLVVSLFLVVAPIIDQPRIEYLYAFLFIIGGLIFYVPFIHFKKELPGMGKYSCSHIILMAFTCVYLLQSNIPF